MAIRQRAEHNSADNDGIIRYHPKGAALDLFSCREDEILLAGPAGTGKSLAALHKAHLILSKYPGAKGFMARKTRTSMTNSCLATYQDHVLKPADKVHFHKQDQVFNYPNGSMLAVIGLDDPERIKSTDWDFGFIQEATECTENDIEIATTRLRNWVVPYQQLIMDCNPDKPTHWLKRRCDKGLTKMLISIHEDNPRLWNSDLSQWTPEGEKYLAKLKRLTGARRARLYAGQWVASEGLIYEQFDRQIHLISLVDLPDHWDEWTHYWSFDWGFIHPLVWLDWMENPNTGQLILFRQIYRTKVLVEDVAREIMDLTLGERPPMAIICDHDAGDRAVFERHTGLYTLPAYKPINIGIQAVQNRLKSDWCANGPGLLFLRDSLIGVDEALKEEGKPTCTEDEFDGYIWDKRLNLVSNSSKDELPVDKDNHGMDSTRYEVAFIDSLADDPEEFESVMIYDGEVNISSH